MRIAQVAPLYESVPPKFYGGTERVVSYLTEELVRMGHEVTLFASGDSVTSARLIAPCVRATRLDAHCVDEIVHHVLMMEQVYQLAAEFEVVHAHMDYFHFSLARRCPVPTLTTLHGRLDLPDILPMFREFQDLPFVSISDAQRAPMSWLNWVRTVHHGIPKDLYSFYPEPGEYLAFLGRISPEKGIEDAIQIARQAGMHLKVAAKVSKPDMPYYEEVVKPLMEHPLVEYVGEIGEAEKNEFLGKAYALLFPIVWPEPFGMVMTEAMACGTPVIAYLRGSVPEVVMPGQNGFIVDSVDAAVEALKEVVGFERARCRAVFEERFTSARMAEGYLEVYRELAELQARAPALPVSFNG